MRQDLKHRADGRIGNERKRYVRLGRVRKLTTEALVHAEFEALQEGLVLFWDPACFVEYRLNADTIATDPGHRDRHDRCCVDHCECGRFGGFGFRSYRRSIRCDWLT